MSSALAEVFPVGDYLAEELDARGWTQAEFAEVLGRPAQFVSEIISNKKEITRESATQIAAAFGTSPEVWLGLQDQYFLWRQAQDRRAQEQLGDVRLRARLKELAPISVMLHRGLLMSHTLAGQETELKALYRIDSIYDEPELLVAARRSKAEEQVTSTQLSWVACVRRLAEQKSVGEFDPAGLQKLSAQLTRIVVEPSVFATLPKLFANVGVRLVFVEAFPGSKMDGCSLLLDNGSPTIGISGRGKRFDKVFFTLLHEAAHIHLGHVRDDRPMLLDDRAESPTLGEEEPADELAGKWALPDELPPIPERISQGWVTSVAESQGIHPLILVGSLQHDLVIPWKTTLVRNAPTVVRELREW